MIKVDTSEAETFLDGMWKDQIPFAASLALNNTAKDVQKAEQQQQAGSFILRRADFILREGAKIPKFSTKTDDPMAVEIMVSDKADFLRKFEGGLTKSSVTGGSIAVPGEWKLRDELIPKQLRPRALKLRAHKTESGKFQLKGKLRTFVAKPIGIFQRVGPGRSDIRLLYLFKKQVKTPAVLMFKQIGEKVIATRWAENWAAAFARAIRSAK